MSAKVFVKGDFRKLFVSNEDSKYKVFYNGKWNNIQSKESIVNNLAAREHYSGSDFIKVYDNGMWVDLALLENYYSDLETKKSVFYQLLTKDNFNYVPKEIGETNIDFRIGLNNLRCIRKFNENFEFENSDIVVYDSLYSFLGKENFYDKDLIYNRDAENSYENINCSFESFLESGFVIVVDDEKDVNCISGDFNTLSGEYLVDNNGTHKIFYSDRETETVFDNITLGCIDHTLTQISDS